MLKLFLLAGILILVIPISFGALSCDSGDAVNGDTCIISICKTYEDGDLTDGQNCSHIFTINATKSGSYNFYEYINWSGGININGSNQIVTIS